MSDERPSDDPIEGDADPLEPATDSDFARTTVANRLEAARLRWTQMPDDVRAFLEWETARLRARLVAMSKDIDPECRF